MLTHRSRRPSLRERCVLVSAEIEAALDHIFRRSSRERAPIDKLLTLRCSHEVNATQWDTYMSMLALFSMRTGGFRTDPSLRSSFQYDECAAWFLLCSP